MVKPVVTSVLLTDFSSVSLPIALLLRPLRQRFIYHFTGSKLTNRQDKPEWFFTQILTWIKDHVQWVQKNVQPVADSINFEHLNIKVQNISIKRILMKFLIANYDILTG